MKKEKKTVNEILASIPGLGWKFRQKNQKAIAIDQGGTHYAAAYYHIIISLRMSIFKYGGWPFKKQTPSELEQALFEHGGVFVFEMENEMYFAAATATGRQRITELNAEDCDIKILGEYNTRITKAFDKQIKENISKVPFIFDNPAQTSPRDMQIPLMDDLIAVHNGKKSNRIHKNKQGIYEVENGQSLSAAARLTMETQDMSPFVIVEKGSKDNPLANGRYDAYTTPATDLYNSYSTENKDILKELQILNGIKSSQIGTKSSAQETDEQTNSMDRDTANIITMMLEQRQRDIKRINKLFGKSISLTLTPKYAEFVNKAFDDNVSENVIKGDEK